MARPAKAAAPPRLPLSRERVLRTAVELADAEGVESLSMRRLGRELGVEAMSLYNHVANKDDLLDGLADIIVGEIEVPSEEGDWKAAMRRRAISARAALTRHPWAAGLIESRTNPSAPRRRYPDAVIGILRRAGFSIQTAVHAFFVLDSYIYGFALQEKSLPSGTPEELAAMSELVLRELPPGEYPYLHEAIVGHVLASGFDYADEFEFGLDLILDGLEGLRDGA